ncbi:MAG: YigZ family protein [Sporocytophaga sp.]|uniref:IMPACT family protein n=1 Tax=Sporocytophaga sp. TaxID=2231183 RepID=UPI001AFFAE8D|nr:YigZ family protein [Sporocytophaga sp.]MBO9699204.1 YigZ family protein [Sporocytophaga sp.]
MQHIYYSIKGPSEGLYKEKGSKFISFAFPVSTETEIKDILERFKKEYYDARHICYAYRIGFSEQKFRANDAGEPAHTAGDPIFNQIKSLELTNTIVIVVRYFGGTKLGKSGLIQAYKTAAEEALKNAEKIEKTEQVVVTMAFEYEKMNEVMKVLKSFSTDFLSQDFQAICSITVQVAKDDSEILVKQLTPYLKSIEL